MNYYKYVSSVLKFALVMFLFLILQMFQMLNDKQVLIVRQQQQIIRLKQSIKADSIAYNEHLKNCSFISKDQLKYGKYNVIYIQNPNRIVWDYYKQKK